MQLDVQNKEWNMRRIGLWLTIALSGCVTVESNNQQPLVSHPEQRSEARIALGLGYMEQGNMPKARENLEKALQHAPNYYRAQLSLAHYFENVGESASAESLYNKALKQHPNNGNVLNNYGTFLCKRGDYQEADQYFRKAIEQPSYYQVSSSYENAALCALKSGDNVQAKRYFIRTIEHDPQRVPSILNLAKLEIEDMEYTQARIRLMKFHQQYGLQVASLRLLIELENQAGNPSLEANYRAKLAEITPDS